jgi:hypothetical protein
MKLKLFPIFVSSECKAYTAQPSRSWAISKDLEERFEKTENCYFEKAEVKLTDLEHEFFLKCFLVHKPCGYSV